MIGSAGQLGTELITALRAAHGDDHVVASDIRSASEVPLSQPYVQLNAMDKGSLEAVVDEYEITQIYHLAAILSAKGEENPQLAWDLNMTSLLNVLELGRTKIKKIFWPSSIAVFGPDTPRDRTPQSTLMNPSTVYGISKLAGERWCEYYHKNFGVDVRSLRYPGLIGYKSLPGGGTTDYAVDIYHKALQDQSFECFLGEDTLLPMMYMDDAVSGTLQLMNARPEDVHIRSSYNLAGMSFTPKEIYKSIQKHFPDFAITYAPDRRQAIADSWPNSIDDSLAKKDWGWQPKFDLQRMTDEIVKKLAQRIAKK